MSPVGAAVYNLASRLVGGVQVTLREPGQPQSRRLRVALGLVAGEADAILPVLSPVVSGVAWVGCVA